jgi:hypothetical protein
MATGNAINADTPGIVGYDGVGNFTGTSAVQYSVVIGGATLSTLVMIAPSATVGNPLVSAGVSSNPVYSATPTVTSITISNAPVSGTDGANKTYVDSAITAVNPATSVVAASTTNLNSTYLNGVSGIGATLTNAGSLAAFTIDGQTPTIGQRVLIKNQTSTFQNGVYTVSTLGTGAIAWILTRALDYDQPSDINNTGVINVLNGTVNALTGWLLNSTVNTVGTDPITYVQYSNAPISVTQYDVLVGGAGNAINSVGPGSAGQYLQSGGNSANPAYSTATLPATATGTGKVLIADGTNWVASTPTFPNASASSGKIIISDGTNWIASTPTYPNTSGSAGKVVISDGTNNVYSTPTFPNASATTRKIIVSDGTNWVASTETYAVPGASGNILTSDGTNWTSAAPATSGTVTTVSVASANGFAGTVANATTTPAITLTTTITGVLSGNGTAISGSTVTQHGVLLGGASNAVGSTAVGSTGQVLQANTGADPTYSTATYPSSSGGTGKILYDNGTNFVESTPTFPASASATSRKIIVSDGTNWVASTETYAVPGASGNILTSDGTNWTSAPAATSGTTLTTVTGTLTNSQIKSLKETPIAAIAAPGAGKVLVALNLSVTLVYGGTNAFVTTGSTTVFSYGSSGNISIATIPVSTINATANTTTVIPPTQNGGVSTSIENTALYFVGFGGSDISGNAANNNTINWSITYFVATI